MTREVKHLNEKKILFSSQGEFQSENATQRVQCYRKKEKYHVITKLLKKMTRESHFHGHSVLTSAAKWGAVSLLHTATLWRNLELQHVIFLGLFLVKKKKKLNVNWKLNVAKKNRVLKLSDDTYNCSFKFLIQKYLSLHENFIRKPRPKFGHHGLHRHKLHRSLLNHFHVRMFLFNDICFTLLAWEQEEEPEASHWSSSCCL